MSMNTLEISRRTIIAAAAAPVMLPALAVPALAADHPDAELIALANELQKVWPEYRDASRTWYPSEFKALDVRHDALARKIMATPAHTVAGLRAKAMVAIHGAPEFWDKPYDDADWDHLTVRSLIEAVCALTGLDAAELVAQS
jgi:hypothetical protein